MLEEYIEQLKPYVIDLFKKRFEWSWYFSFNKND